MFYLFKASPVKREDFEKVQDKFKIVNHVFFRHISSRWLTLEDVTNRLIEQHPALQHYILVSNLITDKERQKNERIRKLVEILGKPILVPEMLFLKSVLPIFTKFTRLFQAEAPLIHILYDELSTLILTLLGRFLKEEILVGKSGAQLYEIDFRSSENRLKKPFVGQETTQALLSLKEKKKLTDSDIRYFYLRVLTFYIDSVESLLKTLPLEN